MSLSSGTRLGRYEIIAPLGAGGMGEVYRAKDLRLDRLVAVKVVREQLANDSDALRRFEREAKAVATLTHPHIVDIHDIGSDSGVTFVVMELLEGETLRARLSRSPLSWIKAVNIGIAVADGMAAAHSKGVIHRDLKPENILLTSTDQVKILDFGLARLKPALTQEDLSQAPTVSQFKFTDTGILIGTLPYMSPEQLCGKAVDERTDIFSFGCILYEMISGHKPFYGKTNAETAAAILKEDTPDLLSSARIPQELNVIVQQCLEKNPESRFHAAHDLGLALKGLSTRSSITKKVEYTRRRFVFVIAIVASLVVLLLALLWRKVPLAPLAGLTRKPIDSIAVLPLTNLSGDPQQEYFSDGMTDALIAELAKIKALHVISRTSVMHYKRVTKTLPEIARELNVDAVVEGSVLREGNRVRITAELIHAPTDNHLWTETYEREIQTILSLQSEIARDIAKKIQVEVTPQEQARLTVSREVNPEAHEAYLKGRFYLEKFTPETVNKSIGYFQTAIAKDPNYALAYVGLAEAYARLPYFSASPPNDAFPKAKAAALKALQLDQNLGDAHAALGYVIHVYDWDWLRAETEFRTALQLNPGSTNARINYGYLLGCLARFNEGISLTKEALQLDPLSLLVARRAETVLFMARKYGDSERQIKKMLEIDPNYPLAHSDLGRNYVAKGMYKEGISEIQKAFRNFGGTFTGSVSPIGDLGYAYAVSGNRNAALKIIEQMNAKKSEGFVSPSHFAKIYVGLGDKDKALQALELSFEVRDPYLVVLKVARLLDPLRSDRRFQVLLERMKFPADQK